MMPAPFTFTLSRFDLRSRDWYAGQFEELERIIASYAAKVLDIVRTGDFTSEGAWRASQPARDAATAAGESLLRIVGDAAAGDRAAIAQILNAEEPTRPDAVESRLARVQALELERFKADDAPNLLDELMKAVDGGDAIRAEVLVDLSDVFVRKTGGQGDDLTEFRLARLKRAAQDLYAPSDKRAAIALLQALDGDEPDSEGGGVDWKQAWASATLGVRLEAILEDDGEDKLVGIYRLDYPMGISSVLDRQNPTWGVTAAQLRRLYTMPPVTETASRPDQPIGWAAPGSSGPLST